MSEDPKGGHPSPPHLTELGLLQALLRTSPSPPTKAAPTTISSRFPSERTLPHAFSRLSGQNHTSPSTTQTTAKAGPSGTSFPAANPFGATPLHVPEGFSPSKVQAAAAPSPKSGKSKQGKKEKQAAGSRQGLRRKENQPTYTEVEETADEIDG
jgi:hypothetical protein